MDDLGQRIRNLRKAKGLTLQDVGRHFEIHRASVSDWENNNTYPDPRRLVELADLLNTSVEYLLTGRETAAWPFPDVQRRRITSLAPQQQRELGLALATALSIIESREQEEDGAFPRDGTSGTARR